MQLIERWEYTKEQLSSSLNQIRIYLFMGSHLLFPISLMILSNAFPYFPVSGNHLVLRVEQGGTWSRVPMVAVSAVSFWCHPTSGIRRCHPTSVGGPVGLSTRSQVSWPCGYRQQCVNLCSQWDQSWIWCTSNSLPARFSSAAEMLEFRYFWAANPSGRSSYQISLLELCLSIFVY